MTWLAGMTIKAKSWKKLHDSIIPKSTGKKNTMDTFYKCLFCNVEINNSILLMVQKSQTTTVWMVLKPCKLWDKLPTSLNWWVYRSSEPWRSIESFSFEIGAPHQKQPWLDISPPLLCILLAWGLLDFMSASSPPPDRWGWAPKGPST